MTVKECINKIENGEITWDNVYDITIDDKENIGMLEEYSIKKKLLQSGLKTAINSLYGALSTPNFLLFNRDIAAGITFTGRFLNRYTAKKIENAMGEKLGYKNVIYCR